MSLQLPGDPNAPDVRRVLAVVTARPGCESRCWRLADAYAELARRDGVSEAVVWTSHGLPHPEGNPPVEPSSPAPVPDDTRQGGFSRERAVSAETRGTSCPERPLSRGTEDGP